MLVGDLINLNIDHLVIKTTVGELTVNLKKIVSIEFQKDGGNQSGLENIVGFSGYSFVHSEAEPQTILPGTIKIFLGFVEPNRAKENAMKKLSYPSTRKRLEERNLSFVDSVSDANVILMRKTGDDIRTEVKSGTIMKSYIDVHGGGGLRSAPVTTVYNIEDRKSVV